MKDHSVAIVGLGGVGSFILELLLRLGLESITVIDDDIISETDINRNLLANYNNVGLLKVEAAKAMAKSVGLNINAYPIAIGKGKDLNFLRDIDFVFDAMDGLNGKVELIDFLVRNAIRFIVAGGCSGTTSIEFMMGNIWDIKGDNLIRRVRVLLRRRGILDAYIPVATVYGKRNFEELYYKNSRGGRNRIILGSWVLSPAVVAINMVRYFLDNYGCNTTKGGSYES